MTTTTIKLLDAWKLAKGLTSDRQAALALGVVAQAVSKWRNGQAHAAPPHAAKMAHDLGWDGLRTLAAIEAERAVDGETKRAWLRLAGKALSVAVLTFAGLGAALLPAPASAASEGVLLRSSYNSVSYVRRWLRRRLAVFTYRPAVC